MVHTSTLHRSAAGRAGRKALWLAALCLAALPAGCGNSTPMSFDWMHAQQTDPGSAEQAQAPVPSGGQGVGAQDVHEGQNDLARRVREYADRLEKQRPERESQPANKDAAHATRSAEARGPVAGPADAPGAVISPEPNPRGAAAAAQAPNVKAEPPTSPARTAAAPKPAAVGPGPIAASPAPGGMSADPDSSVPVVLASAPMMTDLASETGSDNTTVAKPAAGTPALVRLSPEGSRPAGGPRFVAADGPNEAGLSNAPNTGVPAAAHPAAKPQASPGKTLADAIAQAEAQAHGQPADFRAQLQLRLLFLAAGRTREAQAAWPAGSPAERDKLAAFVDAAVALSNGPNGSAAGGDPTDAALTAVDRLHHQLADQAPLKIRTIKLASRVDGFGVVVPFEGDVYRAGQWVIVYSELENMAGRLQNDGQYRTELSLRLEVLSAEGRSVLRQEDPQVIDKSLNQRRDFFLARRLRLPTDLAAGQYVLRVSVEDKQAAKVGESMLRFQVK